MNTFFLFLRQPEAWGLFFKDYKPNGITNVVFFVYLTNKNAALQGSGSRNDQCVKSPANIEFFYDEEWEQFKVVLTKPKKEPPPQPEKRG